MGKQISLIVIFLFFSAFCSAFEKSEFYKVIASNNILELDKCIQDLKSERQSSKINAYTGVALMKRAYFIKDSKEKMSFFSKGAKMLNNEISKNPGNLEYRFLRLVIQERAPKFLRYNEDIQSDKKELIRGYKDMDSFLQTKVLDFAKQSKVLTVNELQ